MMRSNTLFHRYVKRKRPHIMKQQQCRVYQHPNPLRSSVWIFYIYTGQVMVISTSLKWQIFSQSSHRSMPQRTRKGDFFYNDFIIKFCLPGKILHDHGKEIDDNLFKHYAQFCNIRRIRTSPYHSQTNGQTEKMNQYVENSREKYV